MSQDLKLKHLCPHQVIKEALAIDLDRRTLRTVVTPASSTLTVYVNGHEVPSHGVHTWTPISCPLPGPYAIEKGDNDEVRVRVNGGAEQVITLPEGNAVGAQRVVEALSGLSKVEVALVRGYITLTHQEKGEQATLELREGNAHATLGLPLRRFYRGRMALPGWNLVRDPRSEAVSDRVILFTEEFSTLDDTFEVTYVSTRDQCRRCGGLGIENDFRYDHQGHVVLVENETLLLQEVEKIIFTITGTNVFHQWYGTSIFDLIGTKISNSGSGQFIQMRLISEIQTALDRYSSIKERQAQVQPVTLREHISRIISIDVAQDRIDPTVFRVGIQLENRAGKIETFEDTLVVLGSPLRVN